MTSLPEKVRATIDSHRLLNPGDKVVVAVSGGADSVALLHLLWQLRDDLSLTLHAAHLDHRLRADSAEDAEFVRRLGATLSVPVTAASQDVRAWARRRRLSVEEAGRGARYAFFARVAAETGAQSVATGHTRDDHIETVAMRLVQGAPWEGLGGIPLSRPLQFAQDGAIRIIRPLLSVARAEARAFLTERGIDWREDPTNRDVRMLRNWVRLELLPALEGTMPHVQSLLEDTANVCRDADRWLSSLAGELAVTIARRRTDGVEFALEEFRSHPASLQRRMVRWAVQQVAGTAPTLPVVIEDRMVRLASAGRAGDQVDLGTCVLRCGYRALEVVRPQPAPEAKEYRLPVPGEVRAEVFGVTVRAEVLDPPQALEPVQRADEVHLDAAAAGAELKIRSWRRGDRFTPLGLKGKKKVQDLFVDAKVPRWERASIPVITDAQGRILWVVSHRIAEAGRITAATRQIVRLRVRTDHAGQDTEIRAVHRSA